MKVSKFFSFFFKMFSGLLLITASISFSAEAFASADSYEPDNTLQNAKAIPLHDSRPESAGSEYDWIQSHNFYDVGDEDWVKFYLVEGKIYTVEVKEPGSKCNAAIGIYDKFGDPVIPEENMAFAGEKEYTQFTCKADGIYYARIRQIGAAYGEDTDYKLVLYIPIQGTDWGRICGNIKPPVPNAILSTTEVGSLSYNNISYYHIPHPPGSFILTVEATGYETCSKPFEINERQDTTLDDISLKPINNEPPKYHSADYNSPDYEISLSELLRLIQIYNEGGAYHCDPKGEGGYAFGAGSAEERKGEPHDSDYNPQDWNISQSELLRLIQLRTSGLYHSDPAGEDGFAPGKPKRR